MSELRDKTVQKMIHKQIDERKVYWSSLSGPVTKRTCLFAHFPSDFRERATASSVFLGGFGWICKVGGSSAAKTVWIYLSLYFRGAFFIFKDATGNCTSIGVDLGRL